MEYTYRIYFTDLTSENDTQFYKGIKMLSSRMTDLEEIYNAQGESDAFWETLKTIINDLRSIHFNTSIGTINCV